MSRLPLLALSLVAAALVACSDEAPTFSDAGSMDAPEVDVAPSVMDVNRPESLGRVCTRSAQCDDGVPCTMDYCTSDGRCANVPDPTPCDDGVYCNGQETCDARRGCVRGAPLACDDNFACTTDRCDEETRACQHAPRDFDRDGDPDIGCRSNQCPEDGGTDPELCWVGTDCDDRDPRVSGALPEICGDGVDNNCNGQVDTRETGGCTRPPHDRCDDALDVSAGGRFTLAMAGTTGDYPFRCAGGVQSRDAVLRFELREPRDVVITGQPRAGFAAVYLMAQDRCGSTVPAETRACLYTYPLTAWRAHSLPAGEYFVIVGTSSGTSGPASDVVVDATFSAPTPVAANDTCAGAAVIPPEGGTFRGDLVGVADDVSTRCGASTPDVLYRITLTEPRDLTARATGTMSDSVTVSLIDQCVRTPVTMRCDSGSTPSITAHQLPAGTYYLAVEGRDLPSYSLTVTTSAPTPPPAGDVCATALPLVVGTPARGDLSMFESDQMLSCSTGTARDVVYRFEITERLDVSVTARGGTGDYYYLGIQAACGDRSTEHGCRFGGPSRVTQRGLDPGVYYVILRGLRASTYELTLETRPSVAPTAVMGNDTCATAQEIPAGGGLYTGDTTPLRHEYAFPCATSSTAPDGVFRFHVAARSRVLLSMEGSSFDTILWVTRADACPGAALPGLSTFQVCNDDGPGLGLSSSLELTLDAGDYYAFVSGLYETARGAYVLSVTSTPAP